MTREIKECACMQATEMLTELRMRTMGAGGIPEPRVYRMEEDLSPPLKKQKLEGLPEASLEECDSHEEAGEVESQTTSANNYNHVMEKDVGITEYFSPQLPGFFAILKQRYSDFHVHELSMAGTIVQLTNFSIPEEIKRAVTNLDNVFSTDDIQKLQVMNQSCNVDEVIRIKVSGDKEQRTVMHKAIREHFPNLESKTEDGENPEEKVISVQYIERKSNKRGGRSQWPPDRGNYCKFVLYKENKDTMEAVNLLAHLLRVKPSTLHYAGTKDHRAITSQHVTAFRITAERLLCLNNTCRNVKLGNFEYVTEPLKLGNSKGNKFTVVLRQVSCEDHVISDAIGSLSQSGVINYFGMQRFGTSTIPTYQIGKCLLKSDWQGAIDLILKPRPNENEEIRLARQYYLESKDADGAVAKMPKWRSVEKSLLQGLAKHAEKANLLGALNFIPRNTRMMYVHSWQSLIWNKIASCRIRELGRTVQIGDIVRKPKSEQSKGTDECSRKDGEEKHYDGSASEIEFITEDNISSYSIEDVLLPLPGWNVKLPNNKCGEEYLRLLSEEGFTLEQLKHKVKDFSLMGNYRSLIVKPTDVAWELFRYDDVTIPQVLSDVDKMEGKNLPQSLPDGELKGVRLEFSLPPSTYATMVIRELTRLDTSSAYQATLNSTPTNQPS